jgi:tyrosyl-tRNA synthetase
VDPLTSVVAVLTCDAMDNVYHILKERGFVSQVTDELELQRVLGTGAVTGYIGFDPTAPSLHAGSLLPLMALAHLQRAGHRPIAVLGCGTAMVGDPSGKTEMRSMLGIEDIRRNGEAIKTQLSRFVDIASGTALMVDNAEWLLPLKYIEFLRDIGIYFSVNRMLTHESYKIRLEKGLSFLEFNYQLLQAYDFLELFRRYGCVLQLGGDDQWGNIVAGIDLIRRLHGQSAYGLTFPLLATANGEKMGKTARGAVWLDGGRTSPYDFFQYFRNTDDSDVGRFLGFFTFLPMDDVRRLAALKDTELNTAKETLAFEATKIVHGEGPALEARRAAKSAFGGQDEGAEGIPTTELTRDRLRAGILVVDLLTEVGLCKSKSDARRLVQQGGARVGEQTISRIEHTITEADLKAGSVLLRAGKKKLRRIVLVQ